MIISLLQDSMGDRGDGLTPGFWFSGVDQTESPQC